MYPSSCAGRALITFEIRTSKFRSLKVCVESQFVHSTECVVHRALQGWGLCRADRLYKIEKSQFMASRFRFSYTSTTPFVTRHAAAQVRIRKSDSAASGSGCLSGSLLGDH